MIINAVLRGRGEIKANEITIKPFLLFTHTVIYSSLKMSIHNDYRSVNIYQYSDLNVLKLDVNKEPSILYQKKVNPDLHFHRYLLSIVKLLSGGKASI